MIRPLRQQHRLMVCTLGVVLPIAFVAGIAARKPAPAMARLPPTIVGEFPRFESVVWERDDLWETQPIRTRLVADRANRLAVELSPTRDIVRPDLIVYWVTGEGRLRDKLPDHSVLLGVFDRNAPLPLPAEAGRRGGVVLLYSLAEQEVVASSKFFEPANRR